MFEHVSSMLLLAITVLVLGMQETSAYQDCAFIINGRRVDYRHMQIYTKGGRDCGRYRCINGREQIISSGCHYEGQCRAVGSSFLGTDCNTYRCTMPRGLEGGYWQVTTVRTGCQDYDNVCRHPGDRFRYELHGVLRNNCQCQYIGDRSYVSCSITRTFPL